MKLESATPDAQRNTLAERILPPRFMPYARLARWDRPIGWWLLLWPCWWSAAMAAVASGAAIPNLWHMLLFLIGAVAMRGAGCTYNDIVDRDIDRQVERTRARPVASGAISVRAAQIFMVLQSFTGLAVLLQFNTFAIFLGMGSLAVVAIYPFMKRITSWPQIVLGLAFSWGALMGWAAVFGGLGWPPLLLYVGCVLWTIGYDTIYAHQDTEDDAIVGVKSTALLFGERTKPWVGGFYVGAWLLIAAAGIMAGGGIVFALGMVAAGLHLAWQVRSLDIADSALCLAVFKSNRDFGTIVFAAFALDALAAFLV